MSLLPATYARQAATTSGGEAYGRPSGRVTSWAWMTTSISGSIGLLMNIRRVDSALSRSCSTSSGVAYAAARSAASATSIRSKLPRAFAAQAVDAVGEVAAFSGERVVDGGGRERRRGHARVDPDPPADSSASRAARSTFATYAGQS